MAGIWVLLVLFMANAAAPILDGFGTVNGAAYLVCAAVFLSAWFICTRLDAILAALAKGEKP